MVRAVFFRALLVCLMVAGLVACNTTQVNSVFDPNGTETEITAADEAPVQTAGGVILPRAEVPASKGTLIEGVKVAILVPQSGPNAALGEALMQAAQLAVFDLNEPMFQLIPKDTKGTAEGTQKAVDEAAREGARLILGPVFAQEVEAARNAARPYGINVIGFSTDWRVAGDNAYVMGVLPFGQVERITEYAARQGVRRVAVVAGKDMYGDAVLSLFQTAAQRNGIAVVRVARIAADGKDAATAIQPLTGGQKNAADFDALFMPVGGQAAHILASTLKSYGIGGNRIKLMGTGLWDDAQILSDPNMAGAIYAAPAPQVRAAFERNYQRIYGGQPPRLASIGYDAAALAVVLARNASAAGQRVSYDRNAFMNANGFSGVDGIFRFRSNGLVERGMAVLQIGAGNAHLLEAAPTSFVATQR
ncbi:MAG: penicillin-binding protein activator [Alphaproteobacteria bacterium]|nr:penicillin-binding protein activator [Alphaproteobacteria bacterium]